MSREIEDRLRAALSAKADEIGHADLRPAQPPAGSTRRFRRSLPWLAPVMAAAAVAIVVVAVTGGLPDRHSSSNNDVAAGASSAPARTAQPSAVATTPTPVPSGSAFSDEGARDASVPATGSTLPTVTGGGVGKILPSAVLGSTGYWPAGNTRGFGASQPSELDTNGDPSGVVIGITWHDWGSATATGIGQTYLPKPGGGYYSGTVPIELRATALGRCGTVIGYQQLLYRVPTQPGGQPTGTWQLWADASNLCQSR
jgi:hypothetical protein